MNRVYRAVNDMSQTTAGTGVFSKLTKVELNITLGNHTILQAKVCVLLECIQYQAKDMPTSIELGQAECSHETLIYTNVGII